MAISGIQRHRKQGTRPPFETVAALLGFHGGRTVTRKNIDHLFIDMPDRLRSTAGGQFMKEAGEKIVAPLHMADRPAHAEAGPWRGFNLQHVDGKILMDRHTLGFHPVEIRVEQKLAFPVA